MDVTQLYFTLLSEYDSVKVLFLKSCISGLSVLMVCGFCGKFGFVIGLGLGSDGFGCALGYTQDVVEVIT